MAIDTPARHLYNGDGSTRVFPIPTYIKSDDYIRIEIDGVYQSDRATWDIVNNSIIFTTAPALDTEINVQVATSEEALALLGTNTNVDIVAGSIVNVNILGDDITSVNSLSTIITEIVSLYNDKATLDSLYTDKITLDGLFSSKTAIDSLYSIKTKLDSLFADKATLDSLYADKATLDSLYADKDTLDSLYADKLTLDTLYSKKDELNSIFTNIIPNLAEILSADTNATIATTKATEASASATIASTKAAEAAASATLAASYVQDPFPITLTGTNYGTEGTTVLVTDTSWNADADYIVSVDYGSFVDNLDGTYTVTLPDYSVSTSVTLTVNGDKFGYQYNTDTFGIAVQNTVVGDPTHNLPSEAGEETTVNFNITNYDASVTYIVSYSNGSVTDNGGGSYSITMPTYATVTQVSVSIQATRAGDVSSQVVTQLINNIEIQLIADDAYVDNLVADDSTYNDGWSIV